LSAMASNAGSAGEIDQYSECDVYAELGEGDEGGLFSIRPECA
jgi:hypothetical protein